VVTFVEGFEEILARLKFNVNCRLAVPRKMRVGSRFRVDYPHCRGCQVDGYAARLGMVMTYDSKSRVVSAASLRAVDKSIKNFKERLDVVDCGVTELLLGSLSLYGS
jgi:hypothetical protein